MIADKSVKVTIDAVDNATPVYNRIKASVNGLEDAQDRSSLAASRSTAAYFAVGGSLGPMGIAVGIVSAATSALSKELITAGVEADRMRLSMMAATGSTLQGAIEMGFVRSEANRLGLDLVSASDGYVKLAAASRGTALEGQATRDIFSAVASAATALGLSAEQSGGALLAIGQMISKGTVQAEELRGQLGERIPGAFQLAATAMNVTTSELDAMLKKGEVVATDFLPKFAEVLGAQYSGSVAEAAHSAQAEINRFNNMVFDIKRAVMEEGGGRDSLISLVSGATDLLGGFRSVIAEGYRLNMLIDKLGGTMTTLGYATFKTAELMTRFATIGQFGDSFKSGAESMREFNKMYEERYKASEAQMQRLANLEAGLNADGSTRTLRAATPGIIGSVSGGKKASTALSEDQRIALSMGRQQIKDFFDLVWQENEAALAGETFGRIKDNSMARFSGNMPAMGIVSAAEQGMIEANSRGEMTPEQQAQFDASAGLSARENFFNQQLAMETQFTAELNALRGDRTQQELLRIQEEAQQWEMSGASITQVNEMVATRQAELWLQNSQSYLNFAQSVTTMGISYLLVDEQQREQIGRRMLATSIRFLAQGLQSYMLSKSKEHLINAFAAAGRTKTDTAAGLANLAILEAQAGAWAAFFAAMSLNPYGGQAFVPAAKAMTAVAAGAVPTAIGAVTAAGAISITTELGLAAMWGLGGMLVGGLGEAGASAIEGGTSGSRTPAGYGAGSPGSPVITQPVSNSSNPITVNLTIINPIGEKRWFEENLPEILKDFSGRKVEIGYVPK